MRYSVRSKGEVVLVVLGSASTQSKFEARPRHDPLFVMGRSAEVSRPHFLDGTTCSIFY